MHIVDWYTFGLIVILFSIYVSILQYISLQIPMLQMYCASQHMLHTDHDRYSNEKNMRGPERTNIRPQPCRLWMPTRNW